MSKRHRLRPPIITGLIGVLAFVWWNFLFATADTTVLHSNDADTAYIQNWPKRTLIGIGSFVIPFVVIYATASRDKPPPDQPS